MLWLFLTACLVYDTSCGDVGRAIADRTLACEGSSSMGIGRAEALQLTYQCPIDGWWDITGMPRGCARAIEDLDCDTVRAYGDDLEAWLSTSSACDGLVLKDGFAARLSLP